MILIVDDVPENIYSLKRILEHNGFQVDTALSGREALKKVLANMYVLIILDVQMPGMDGFEVAESISGIERTKHTGIIFLSANSTNADLIIKGYQRGAVDYITKPVDANILLLKVKTMYSMYEANIRNEHQQQEIKKLYASEKKLNETLLKSTQKLVASQAMAKMGNWEYTVASNELECSPEIHKLLSVSSTETITIAFLLRHMLKEEKKFILNFWDRIGNNESFEFIHGYKTDHGKIKYLKQYGKIDRVKGKPYKITGITQDVSGTKEQEQEVMKAYQRYELVNLATNDLLWDWNLANNNVECNNNITDIYGYSKEAVGNNIDWWESIIHPKDSQRLFTTFIETALKHEKNCSFEYRLKCADGTYKEVFSQSYCLYNKNGSLLRIVSAIKDISQLKEVESKLQEIAFSSSHIIRRPLANLLGLLDLLENNGNPSKELIDLMRKSGNELDDVIHNITKMTY